MISSSTALAMRISAAKVLKRVHGGQAYQRPIINHPARVLKTGRAANVERLRGVPDVIVPRMRRCRAACFGAEAPEHRRRQRLFISASGARARIPYRPSFLSRRLRRTLAAAIADFPGDDVWLIEQLDARDGKGMFRKFRVMIVDGQLYPLHLAISQDWKVHYFTADMADSAANRGGRRISQRHGERHRARGVAALERIAATLDLDYGGIDFAVNAPAISCSSKPTPPWSWLPLSATRNGPIAGRPSIACFRPCAAMLTGASHAADRAGPARSRRL